MAMLIKERWAVDGHLHCHQYRVKTFHMASGPGLLLLAAQMAF